MPTTTVHLPAELLEALDAVAARRRQSRNRLFLEACQRLVEEDRGAWPEGFFDRRHLSAADRRELEAATEELVKTIGSRRRNRRRPPL
jgi:metal-responsive CopG/Arc/MetJ family transcriptional regulator